MSVLITPSKTEVYIETRQRVGIQHNCSIKLKGKDKKECEELQNTSLPGN